MAGYHTPTPNWMVETVPGLRLPYVNLFQVGTADAVQAANHRLPPTWTAGYTDGHPHDAVPGAVRIGQFRIHSGDSDFVLYAVPTSMFRMIPPPDTSIVQPLITALNERRDAMRQRHQAYARWHTWACREFIKPITDRLWDQWYAWRLTVARGIVHDIANGATPAAMLVETE